MSDTKLIMFDFADTLATLSPNKETLVQKYIFNKTGIKVPITRLEEIYHCLNNTYFYSSVNIDNAHDKKNYYMKYNRIYFELLGLSHIIDSEGLYDFIKDSNQNWKLKEGAEELLHSLKRDGFLLSLVSNFDIKLKSILRDMNIYELFDSVYISQEYKLEKPNLSFFKLPLKQHDIDVEHTYFIGDNYHLDFLPAYQLKMHSILLDEKNLYPLVDKQHKISSLHEYRNIIGI